MVIIEGLDSGDLRLIEELIILSVKDEEVRLIYIKGTLVICLLYTSDAADDSPPV